MRRSALASAVLLLAALVPASVSAQSATALPYRPPHVVSADTGQPLARPQTPEAKPHDGVSREMFDYVVSGDRGGTAQPRAVIIDENYGGSYPNGWSIGHDGGVGGYSWAWPLDYAYCYADPNGSNYYYPDDLHVFMEKRNVSFVGYDTATLQFLQYVDCEDTYDYFTVNVRDQSGNWYYLYGDSGPDNQWRTVSINLDQFAGQSGLYIQFRFDSDGSISGEDGYLGVAVDNILLTASNTNDAPDYPYFITTPPDKLYPTLEYQLTIDYTDPDGRSDLSFVYLRLAQSDSELTQRQTLGWQLTDAPFQFADETAHLYDLSATKTNITNGYRIVWHFRIDWQWAESTNIDYYAWGLDLGELEGPHVIYDRNADYENDLVIASSTESQDPVTAGDTYNVSGQIFFEGSSLSPTTWTGISAEMRQGSATGTLLYTDTSVASGYSLDWVTDANDVGNHSIYILPKNTSHQPPNNSDTYWDLETMAVLPDLIGTQFAGSYFIDKTAKYGIPVLLEAKLEDSSIFHFDLQGKTVHFDIYYGGNWHEIADDGISATSFVTDDQGIASVYYTAPTALAEAVYPIRARFDGDSEYAPCTLSRELTLNKPQWLYLVYLCADNNLEAYGEEDFYDEMWQARANTEVSVVVLFDRAEGDEDDNTQPGWAYSSGHSDWKDTRCYRICENSLVYSSWGERNLGDPATLQSFLSTAVNSCLAHNTAVVLWNHGSGFRGAAVPDTVVIPEVEQRFDVSSLFPESEMQQAEDSGRGICYDDSHSNDGLTLVELSSALDPFSVFEIVGFDACLMGMAEIAYQMLPYADMMIGSAETESGNGWAYDEFLTPAHLGATTTPAQLGARTVATADQATLACWDLGSQIVSLKDEMSDFALAIVNHLNEPGVRNLVISSASASFAYNWPAFYDLRDFANEIASRTQIAEIDQAAAAVAARLINPAFRTSFDTDYGGDIGGMSAWLPVLVQDYNDGIVAYETLDFTIDSNQYWDDLIRYLTDLEPPTCMLTAPTPGWYRSTLMVSAYASDAKSEVRYVAFEYSRDASSWHALPGPDSADGYDYYGGNGWGLNFDTVGTPQHGTLNDPSVFIRAQAVDFAGLASGWTTPVEIGVDNGAPSMGWVAHQAPPLAGEHHIGASISDALAGVLDDASHPEFFIRWNDDSIDASNNDGVYYGSWDAELGGYAAVVPVSEDREGQTLYFRTRGQDLAGNTAWSIVSSGALIEDDDVAGPTFADYSDSGDDEPGVYICVADITDASGVRDDSVYPRLYIRYDDEMIDENHYDAYWNMDRATYDTFVGEVTVGPERIGQTLYWRVFAQDLDNSPMTAWSEIQHGGVIIDNRPVDIYIAPTSLVFDETTRRPAAGQRESDAGVLAAHDRGLRTRPDGVGLGSLRAERLNAKILGDVPCYHWYNGCAPTAVAMILGYWDARGFGDLFPGNAAIQNTTINLHVSSAGNYDDYCLPLDGDEYEPILPDRSEPPFGDEHVDDSLADYMLTSQSYHDLHYGWSSFANVGPAFASYATSVNPQYLAWYENQSWSQFTWADLKAEIDAGRPAVFLVDSDGNNDTDHFVPVIGYDESADEYACYDTWDGQIHWYEFAGMSQGQEFGVAGAVLLGFASAQSFTITNEGGGTLQITGMTLEQSSSWVTSIMPAAPLSITAGQSRAIVVTVDPTAGAPGENTDRVLVTSNDPDENPYPDGVYLTLINDAGPPPAAPLQPILTTNPACQSAANELSWNAVAGADYYVVCRDGLTISEELYGVLVYAFASQAGTYAVRAGNAYGESPLSPGIALTIKPVPAPPGAPLVIPNPYPPDTQDLTVSWDAIEHAVGYSLWLAGEAVATTSATTVQVAAQPGMYSVSAIGECGESDPGAATLAVLEPHAGPVWYVALDGDDVTGNGSADYPFRSIAHSLTVVPAGGTLQLMPGIYQEYGLTIPSRVTLRGSPADPTTVVIDAQNSGVGLRIENTYPGPTNILGLTVANATSALQCYISGDVTFEDCRFTGSSSHALIGSEYGDMVFRRCDFAENAGDGVNTSGEGLVFTDCKFYSNRNGADFNLFTPLTLNGCEFYGNSESGLLIRGGTVTATACEFHDNGSVGVQITEYSSTTLSQCMVSGNGVGVKITGEALGWLVDCQILDNDEGPGIEQTYHSDLVMSGTLIASNHDGAIAASGGSVIDVSTSTIVGNEGSAAIECAAAGQIASSIIAFNPGGQAVDCMGTGSVALNCSDLHGNAGGDWVGCIAGQANSNGNISQDPQLCDWPSGDFTVASTSPCLPDNHPDECAIGAFADEAGCTPVPEFVATPASLVVPEGGTAAFDLTLNWPPSGTVSVDLEFTTDDPGLSLLGPISLVFDGQNWSQPQAITIAATEDDDYCSTGSTLRVRDTAGNLADLEVAVTEVDNDDLGPDTIALTTLTGCVSPQIEVGPFVPLNLYIVLVNPSLPTISGWEAQLTIDPPNAMVVGVSFPNGGTNFGSYTSYLVGYQWPVDTTPITILANLSLIVMGDGPVTIGIEQLDGGSFGYYDDGGQYVAFTNAIEVIINGQPEPLSPWTDITAATPLGDPGASLGSCWGDYDLDGDPDLYVTNVLEPNHLYRNDGSGVFTDVTGPPLDDSAASSGAAWGDYDGDGDPDLYVANSTISNRLYRNDGGGVFTDVTAPPLDGTAIGGCTWADYDQDGDLDLALANVNGPNRLFRNDADDGFVDVTPAAFANAGPSRAAVWGDCDDDGDQDLYVAVEGANLLLENVNGVLAAVTPPLLADTGSAIGAAWGDYDNDGRLDLYLVNQDVSNRLFHNDGSGAFSDATAGPLTGAVNDRSPAWADVDNDGDLDLFLANNGQSDRLLRNDGGTFTDITDAVIGDIGPSHGASFADIDGDGDLDLHVSEYDDTNHLLRNDHLADNHWLQVRLTANSGTGNVVGARVSLTAEGVTQIRELPAGSGYLSQQPLVAYFGLGAAAVVDALTVRWPDGVTTSHDVPAVDQVLAIERRTRWHVAVNGDDATGDGSSELPFRTIQHAVDVSAPADTVLVEPGTYNENISVRARALASRYLVDPDPAHIAATVIDGSGGLCALNVYQSPGDPPAEVVGFTITGGVSEADYHGAGVYCTCDAAFRNLVITGNHGWGLAVFEGFPLVEDVLISDNTMATTDNLTFGGGINWHNCGLPATSPCLVGVTIADNEGIGLVADAKSLQMDRVLIAENTGQAMTVTYDLDPTYLPVMSCVDLFGNGGGEWEGAIAAFLGEDGNIALDPLFCGDDHPDDPYTLRADSPCLAVNNPDCGQIGACGQGCETVTFVIAGTILDEASHPVADVLLSGFPTSVYTDIAGHYETAISLGWPGATITPIKSAYAFDPTSRTYGPPSGDLTAEDYTATNDGSHDWYDVAADPWASATRGTAMAWGDYDDDGDPDLLHVVTSEYGETIYHTLYQNDGAGGLSPIDVPVLQVNGYGSSASWADFNGDGLVDLYLGHLGQANLLLRNEGGGAFTSLDLGSACTDWNTLRTAWVDWNLDGVLDLFMTTYQDPPADQTNLLLDGAHGFAIADEPAVARSGPYQGFVWSDLDGDNDPDLVVVNENAYVEVYVNRAGHGLDDPIQLSGYSGAQGVSAMDWDLDGDQDLLITYWDYGARLWLNLGNLQFGEADDSILEADGHGQDAVWGDYDNDGWPDLYITMYDYYGSGGDNALFHNESGQRLSRVDEPLIADSGKGKGAAWIDVDGDGQLDLALNNYNGPNHLWINQIENENGWLQVDLRVQPGDDLMPRTPIGAKVTVTVAGHSQTQEVRTTSGYCSGSTSLLHFGTGLESLAPRVYVVWPRRFPGGGYNSQTLFDVALGQRLVIHEAIGDFTGVDEVGPQPTDLALHNFPNPFNPQTTIVYELPEAGNVTLRIYDLQGRLVRTLLTSEAVPVGRHEVVWRGQDGAGRALATGVYFCRIQVGDRTLVRRITLAK